VPTTSQWTPGGASWRLLEPRAAEAMDAYLVVVDSGDCVGRAEHWAFGGLTTSAPITRAAGSTPRKSRSTNLLVDFALRRGIQADAHDGHGNFTDAKFARRRNLPSSDQNRDQVAFASVRLDAAGTSASKHRRARRRMLDQFELSPDARPPS